MNPVILKGMTCCFVSDLHVFPSEAHYQVEGGMDVSQLEQCAFEVMLLLLSLYACFD